MDFAVHADHRVKLTESEKGNELRGLVRKLEKKLWDMKVKVILIVIGTICIVTKRLVQVLEDLKIRGRVGTIQTKLSLRSARILRRVLET